MNGFTVDIKIQDSTPETIQVVPVANEGEEFRGVYKLYKVPPRHDTYLGEMAFKQENPFDWEYYGNILNIKEQEQIAGQIVKRSNDYSGI